MTDTNESPICPCAERGICVTDHSKDEQPAPAKPQTVYAINVVEREGG